jgi:hypothetical protein
MRRQVEPEWLDELPPGDPLAVGSRRDLRRLNVWMRHHAILANVLRRGLAEGSLHRVVDLGAGDGDFLLRVARRLPMPSRLVQATLLDRSAVQSPELPDAFAALGWGLRIVVSDVLDWLRRAENVPSTAFVTNLFLHHVTQDALPALFELIRERAQLFVAIEPRRDLWSLISAQCVGAIGCNSVTRHDAVASVRAGFTARELSEHWSTGTGWRLVERRAGLFSHLFIAERIGGAA